MIVCSFFLPLYYLTFSNYRLLITRLVSSNISYARTPLKYVRVAKWLLTKHKRWHQQYKKQNIWNDIYSLISSVYIYYRNMLCISSMVVITTMIYQDLIRVCAFYLVIHTDYIEWSLDFEKEYYLCVSHRIRKHKTHY